MLRTKDKANGNKVLQNVYNTKTKTKQCLVIEMNATFYILCIRNASRLMLLLEIYYYILCFTLHPAVCALLRHQCL